MSSERGALFVVSAPSGAGKTTLIQRLLEWGRERELPLEYSVSHTTRPPRPSEVPGSSYHFVDEETFRSMIARGDFLEWAEVHAHLKGTSLAAIAGRLERGVDVLLDIDVQGADQVRRKAVERGLNAVTVFVLPPGRAELASRLDLRGEDGADQVEIRLDAAIEEIRRAVDFDYVIVNDRLDVALEELRSILLASRCRRDRMQPRIQAVLRTFLSSDPPVSD